MQEKVDLKDRVEELEHRCIQLSGETDTIGEQEARAWGRGSYVVDREPQHLSSVCLPSLPAGEYIALYQNQRAVLKERHREKEAYISRLARDKEEMKVGALTISVGRGRGEGRGGGVECLSLQVKLLELQELVLRLVNERNEWYGKFVAAAQNPAGEAPAAPSAAQELGTVDSQNTAQDGE